MKELKLTNTNKVALVDDEDYQRCVNFSDWYLARCSKKEYIKSTNKFDCYLHRFILNVHTKSKPKIDHKNKDGLDCQKFNLRFCDTSQNNVNSKLRVTNTSGYRGVCWDSKKEMWMSRAYFKGKVFFLGYFKCKIEAAIVYDDKVIELFGEFATLNFPSYGS